MPKEIFEDNIKSKNTQPLRPLGIWPRITRCCSFVALPWAISFCLFEAIFYLWNKCVQRLVTLGRCPKGGGGCDNVSTTILLAKSVLMFFCPPKHYEQSHKRTPTWQVRTHGACVLNTYEISEWVHGWICRLWRTHAPCVRTCHL